MANILIEQAFKALDEIQDEIEVTVKDLKESKEEVDLPKEVKFTASEVGLDTDSLADEDEYISEILSDLLSDTYGFCHYGFDYDVVKNEKGEPSEFICKNIKWDTSESLDKYITEEDDLEDKKENVRRAYKGGDMFDVYDAFEEIDKDKTNKIAEKTVRESHYAKETGIKSLDDLWGGFADFGGNEDYDEVLLEVIHALDEAFETHIYDDIYEAQKVCEKCGKNPCECLKEEKKELDLETAIKNADDEILDDVLGKDTAERKLAGAIKAEEKHVCEKCGKEVCECNKLTEEPENTTTTISVLDDGEKVIKQVGYSALTKKLVNGKPVYRVKYAPGYYVNDIEAKNDYEATRRFLGLNECLKESEELERDYYVVSYGNPYNARVMFKKETALETAKSLNSVKDKLGNWEVYHYTQPKDGELTYEIIKEELDDVAREEYCVLVNGNNEECFNDEVEAIKFARERFAEEGNDSVVKVLLVKYGPKDEHGDEPELGFETIWASKFDESLKESKSELAIKYWVDEEHRDQGISDLYFGEIKDLEDAKHIADKLFDEYASVEVVKNVDTDHEEVLYGRYPEEESLNEGKEALKKERDELWSKMPDCTKDELQRLIDIRKELGDDDFYTESLTSDSLNEALSKDEKSVSEEHKEEHTVCAECGSEDCKYNDPETKEPLCADCYAERCEQIKEEEEEKSLEESITVNINDEAEVKKAKEEVEKSEKTADETEIIVDVDAESIEELKDSYVGNVILVCEDCLTPRFIKPELLKKDEETGLYNVGETCPHCGSEKGYKAEGQVAKASVDVDLEKTETTGASEPEVKDEEKVEVEETTTEEPKLPSAVESKEEPSRLEKVDLNEQRFDRLVNKFVHSTYENVENYKTNSLYLDDDNSLIVEGVITYKSGKEKQAHFKLVEKKLSTTKEDVIALTGICEAFNTDEKAFTFRGNLKENKLDLNSLTYNFTTKVLNESKNIKGKVCIKY